MKRAHWLLDTWRAHRALTRARRRHLAQKTPQSAVALELAMLHARQVDWRRPR